MSDLARALMLAIRVHAGQTDKQGEPYLLHVLRVVEAVSDEAKVVAALHDVLEDGPKLETCALDLAHWLDREDFEAVRLLTRREGMVYGEYIDRLTIGADARIAREVKLADLRDNLARIPTSEAYNRRMHDERAHVASSWPGWDEAWGSLRRRYEKAIATLESPRSCSRSARGVAMTPPTPIRRDKTHA